MGHISPGKAMLTVNSTESPAPARLLKNDWNGQLMLQELSLYRGNCKVLQ